MTIKEAQRIVKYTEQSNPTEAQMQALKDALAFLIEETHDTGYMMYLGGIYYDERKFDLALKYYEMAAEQDDDSAYECLGYIWYYGRTGEKDYKKAFEYFSKAAQVGNLVAAYKVADMYREGYYVEKDYNKYCRTIESLYPRVRMTDNLGDPLPEISMRLAAICKEQGRTDEAILILLKARPFLAERIMYNPFFGDLTNMEHLINDLYEMVDCDLNNFMLYDLHHILQTPCKVEFDYRGSTYKVESIDRDGKIMVRFDKKQYDSIRVFFAHAAIDGRKLVTIPYDLKDFRVR